MTMLMVNIAEAKAKLSEYVEAVAKGERVIICNRNRPVAELRPIDHPAWASGSVAHVPGWKIDPAFFDPLSDEELGAWEGGAEPGGASRVAERQPPYSDRKARRKRP